MTRAVPAVGWAWIALYTLVDGICVSVLSFVVALAHVDVLTADVLSLVEIPLCVLAAAWLQRQRFGWRGVAAIALVCGGLLAVGFGEADGGGAGPGGSWRACCRGSVT